MEKNKNKRIIFDLPEEITTGDVIYAILKDNGLEESKKEYLEKSVKGKETRLAIIRDAALTMVQKKIPDKKLAELLAKHLETSEKTTENLIADIKQKLIPYAKEILVPEEEERVIPKLSTQEVILEKIRSNTPPEQTPTLPTEKVKNIDIKNVEENAEKLKKGRATKRKENIVEQELQRKEQSDKYRELAE